MAPERSNTAPRTTLRVLVLLIAALAAVAAAIGVVGDPHPVSVRSVRGAEVLLYGGGVYAYDTLFNGAGNRGTDAVTLALGIPVLLAATWQAGRGSLRGTLLLPGALVWFLYVYATLAVSAAFNALFIVYTILFSASLYALVLALDNARQLPLRPQPGRALPRRAVAVFMVISGAVTALVWLGPVLAAQLAGQVPDRLDTYTTAVTISLDTAVIVPAAFIAGVLTWRGSPLGYVYAVPLLTLEAALAPLMAAQTISQVFAGVDFTTGEVIGFLGGFAVLALVAGVILTRLLAAVAEHADGHDQTPHKRLAGSIPERQS